MFRFFLGILAILQILGGIFYLLSSEGFAAITFDSQLPSTWLKEDTATVFYGSAPPPTIVSIGSITINQHSH